MFQSNPACLIRESDGDANEVTNPCVPLDLLYHHVLPRECPNLGRAVQCLLADSHRVSLLWVPPLP